MRKISGKAFGCLIKKFTGYTILTLLILGIIAVLWHEKKDLHQSRRGRECDGCTTRTARQDIQWACPLVFGNGSIPEQGLRVGTIQRERKQGLFLVKWTAPSMYRFPVTDEDRYCRILSQSKI